MSDSVAPDEKAHGPSHLYLCCLQKPVIIDCGSEGVNRLENWFNIVSLSDWKTGTAFFLE